MHFKKLTAFLTFNLFLTFVQPAFNQNKNMLLEPPTTGAAPFSTAAGFAKKNGIALSEVELADYKTEPQKGNCVTLLVTLFQENSSWQWLAIVLQDNLTREEMRLKPLPDMETYSSTGRVLYFKNTRTALNVHFIGPFTESGNDTEEKLQAQLKTPYRKLVGSEQINFGLDRYGETAIALTKRCDSVGVNMNSMYHIGDSGPLSERQLEKGKHFVNLLHPTEEEERVIFSVANALNSFLSAALDIDDFSDVVDNVIEKPPIWKVVTQFGVRRFLKYDVSTVRPVDASYFGINLPAYKMPIQLFLNDHIALQAAIIITSSRPPLQTCAGIIGVYAEHPNDKSRKLLIQVMAGRL